MKKEFYSAQTSETTLPHSLQEQQKSKRRGNRSMARGLAKSLTASNPRNAWTAVIFVAVWAGLLLGGYYLANTYIQKSHAYIDEKIKEVELANKQQIEQVENQMQGVKSGLSEVQEGLASIQEELHLTGETLGGTDKTKQALNTRIDQLNKQLNELKTSLKKLEDAARAW